MTEMNLYQYSSFKTDEDYEFDQIINNTKHNSDLFDAEMNYQRAEHPNPDTKFQDNGFYDHFDQDNHMNDQQESLQQYPNYINNNDQNEYHNLNGSQTNYNAMNTQINDSQPISQIDNEDNQQSQQSVATINTGSSSTSQQQQQQKRLPIRFKVQRRKEKVQMMKKMKDGALPAPPQAQTLKQIEEINNSHQESESTDIEKMVVENQERESSNNTVVSCKKLGKKIKKKEKECAKALEIEFENDESPQDKRSQQKIKNRMSAQKSRDQKKEQLQNLQNQVAQLENDIKILKLENMNLKQKVEKSVCSRCLSSSQSTEDSSSDYIDDFMEGQALKRKNYRYFDFGMNPTSMVMLIACLCIIGVQMQSTGGNFHELSSTSPMVFLQRNSDQQIQQKCPSQEDQHLQIDDLSSNALSLYGIDEKYVQSDSIIDTKLLEGFGKPKLGNMDMMNFYQNTERQNDEIICPNSHIILYGKDPTEKYNIVNLVLNNQTNFYSAYKGQYYPLHQDNQNEQIKLTCLILKYEQISTDSQQL